MKIRTAKIVLWREAELTFNPFDRTDEAVYELHNFSYPETKIDFKISHAEEERPDACMFKIYGVSKETYNLFKPSESGKYDKAQYVSVYYGYDDEQDLVYHGILDRVIYSFDNGSQTLTGLIDQNINKFTNMSKSISFSGKTTLSEVMGVVSSRYGYNVKRTKDVNGDISIGRFSFIGNIDECMKAFLPSRFGYYIDLDNIYIYRNNKQITREIMLSMENGLLAYPSEDSKGEKTTIKSKLIPSLNAGAVIKVPVDDIWYSEKDTGEYRKFSVLRYASSFSNGLGTTEMECEEIDK